MRLTIILFFTSILISCNRQKPEIESGTYKIILTSKQEIPMGEDDNNKLDTILIKRLNEPLKSLTALYSAFIGSFCDNDYCELTTALGLGKQGSEKHIQLIKKYFQKDRLADYVIKQNCILGQDGSSFYNNYNYLTFIVIGDTVKVNYNYYYYAQGDEGDTTICDIYLYKNKRFKVIKRDDKWIE